VIFIVIKSLGLLVKGLLIILGGLAVHAYAAERTRPVFAIIDFFPFGYLSSEQNAEGMAFDIEKVLEKYSGIDIDGRLMSTPRALRSASVGQTDLLFSYKDDDMVPNVTWLGNVGCLVPLVVPRKGSGITSLADLNKRKRIGFVGLGYFDINRRHQWDLEPVVLNNNFLMVNMLSRGRVDAIIVNDAVLNAFTTRTDLIENVPEDWISNVAEPIHLASFETHISISNDSPFISLVPTLKKAIKKARKAGEFIKVFKKYGSPMGGYCYNSQELIEKQWLNLPMSNRD